MKLFDFCLSRLENSCWVEHKLCLLFTCRGNQTPTALTAHRKLKKKGNTSLCLLTSSLFYFKNSVHKQITGRLDETKLQQWLMMEHSNVEAKR